MKKYIYNIFFSGLLSLLTLGLVSCEDYLDKEPATDVDPEAAFKNFYNFQGFVEEIYCCVPNMEKGGSSNSCWNFGEEDHYSVNGSGWPIEQADQGNYWGILNHWAKSWLSGSGFSTSATNSNDRQTKFLWQGGWYGIRKCNMGLANLDKLNGTQEEKDLIAGQMYFYRAWFHFNLISYWGGIPYVDYVLPSDEQLTLPRESFVDCALKAAADFKKAAELLPVDWDNTQAGKNTIGNNQLRINKVMAMAYRAKAYLYAGSPWMDKSPGVYNAEYCKESANIFGELLKMVENKEVPYELADWSEYAGIYMTNGQGGLMPGLKEAIFRSPSYGNAFWNYGNSNVSQRWVHADISQFSWAQYPTANYANYFGMANGLPINDSNDGYFPSDVPGTDSGYDPEYPWRGRDPRFYNTYCFDTQRYLLGEYSALAVGTKSKSYATLCTYVANDADSLFAISYRNQVTRTNNCTTGYLMIKFAPIGFNKYDNKWNNESYSMAWMRLADVYLMYAEAVANGWASPSKGSDTYPQLTAVGAVDKIRERAGVGAIAAKYRGSTSAFMKELIRERAVELAFEGHRFTDLRRWRLIDKYPYNIKTKIEFDRAKPADFDKVDPTNNKVLNLRDEILVERKFTEKHLWLPFAKSDTYLYPDFPQNPGW